MDSWASGFGRTHPCILPSVQPERSWTPLSHSPARRFSQQTFQFPLPHPAQINCSHGFQHPRFIDSQKNKCFAQHHVYCICRHNFGAISQQIYIGSSASAHPKRHFKLWSRSRFGRARGRRVPVRVIGVITVTLMIKRGKAANTKAKDLIGCPRALQLCPGT
jgi:hypothetical protein